MSDIVMPAVISNTVVATLCIGLFRLHLGVQHNSYICCLWLRIILF